MDFSKRTKLLVLMLTAMLIIGLVPGTPVIAGENNAPVIDSGVDFHLGSTDEDHTSEAISVSSILEGKVTDNDDDNLGLAITGTTGNGTWQYSVHGTNDWNYFGAVSENSALLLADTYYIRYYPDHISGGTATFTFRVWDQTSNDAGNKVDPSPTGGTSAFSTETATAILEVENVNDAPALLSYDLQMTATNEDTLSEPVTVNNILSSIGVIDADPDSVSGMAITVVSGNGEWQYSLDGEFWHPIFNVSEGSALLLAGNYTLRYKPDEENGGLAQITFRAWDQSDGSDAGTKVSITATGGINAYSLNSGTVSIDVADINDAPRRTLSPIYRLESTDAVTTSSVVKVSDVLTEIGAKDVDTGAVLGLAITGSTGSGAWEYYSIDEDNWTPMETVNYESALLLTSAHELRYVPDGNTEELAELELLVWDQTSDTSETKVYIDNTNVGGTSAFSENYDRAWVELTVLSALEAKNPIPTLSLTENESTSIRAYDIAEHPVYEDFTIISISGEPDSSIATAVLDNGILSISGVADGTTSVTVEVSDGGTPLTIEVPITVIPAASSGGGGGSIPITNPDGEINAEIITEANGSKTVEFKAVEAIFYEKTKSVINDDSRLSFEAPDADGSADIYLRSDGTVRVTGMANGSKAKFNVSFDLGDGQKVLIGTIDVSVSRSGEPSVESALIDPYGTITDAVTGEIIQGARVTLYYADTERNRSNGKTPHSQVDLPVLSGFDPSDNRNPQYSDTKGFYAFMVFPTSDYHLASSKEGYYEYISPTITVEQEIVKWDFRMNPVRTEDAEGEAVRLSGPGRVDTAISIAKATYREKVNNVILATAGNYPDALSGSVLAYRLDAPVILVGSTQADQDKVLAYLKENLESTGTVYILGGTGVVSTAMEDRIQHAGFKQIKRLDGKNRYETSLKIAEELDIKEDTSVIIVSGETYPDALAISSIAASNQFPVLLTKKNELPEVLKNKLKEINPGKVFIIGLEGAVSQNIESQIAQTINIEPYDIVRVGGQDRYQTSVEIAKKFPLAGSEAGIATGASFPDALAGSVYAARYNAPLILVNNNLSTDIREYLINRKVTRATIFGGEGAVSEEISRGMLQLISQ